MLFIPKAFEVKILALTGVAVTYVLLSSVTLLLLWFSGNSKKYRAINYKLLPWHLLLCNFDFASLALPAYLNKLTPLQHCVSCQSYLCVLSYSPTLKNGRTIECHSMSVISLFKPCTTTKWNDCARYLSINICSMALSIASISAVACNIFKLLLPLRWWLFPLLWLLLPPSSSSP